ncbi:MAG TPA: hypothetical protein VJ553_05590 [Candidatus Paceibacterota bacterium]|nr:hypothetical protein [Candidatus Paceibacterota bacterium]
MEQTKGDIRRARKAARAAGESWTVERRPDGGLEMMQGRTAAQERAHATRMDRWARRYDALNGAPESDDDR